MPDSEFHLSPHETLELHELLGNKAAILKKLHSSKTMVRDSGLKSFIEDAIDLKTAEIRGFQHFLVNNSQGTLQLEVDKSNGLVN